MLERGGLPTAPRSCLAPWYRPHISAHPFRRRVFVPSLQRAPINRGSTSIKFLKVLRKSSALGIFAVDVGSCLVDDAAVFFSSIFLPKDTQHAKRSLRLNAVNSSKTDAITTFLSKAFLNARPEFPELIFCVVPPSLCANPVLIFKVASERGSFFKRCDVGAASFLFYCCCPFVVVLNESELLIANRPGWHDTRDNDNALEPILVLVSNRSCVNRLTTDAEMICSSVGTDRTDS